MIGRLSFPELFELPTVVDLETAAKAVGVSTNLAYRLIAADRFPCPVMRLGWRYQVSTAALMKALNVELPAVRLEDVRQGAEFAHSLG